MQHSPEIAEKPGPAFHPEGRAGADAHELARLFAQLAELSPSERQVRLARLEEQDPARATELRTLLDTADRAGDFLGILDNRVGESVPPMAGEFTTGQQIGPYRLERLLGSGGAGAVWLASDRRLARMVALKLFAARPESPRGVAHRLMLREARAVAQLDHPNVAAVHDVGETTEGVAYMAMPWCEGGSLADRLKEGALTAETALAMALDLASALAEAHAHGVLHRDVKPGNVLFSPDGRARLGDFGIALPSGNAVDRDCAGTLRYMAPEILRGAAADARSDLWSLGVTIIEALTAVAPFEGASAASAIQQILAGDPLRDIAGKGIPPALRPVLHRLLQKNPADRPQSAADLQRELALLRTRFLACQDHHLPPVPISPLVGRVRLLATATGLLDQVRLVTLTGPGGTGKTRLALELGCRREALHRAGACFVELAAVASADLVPGAVADALGLRQGGSANAAEQVHRFCAWMDLLLVLDNCEHLPDSAPFVSALLAQAPGLRILATSRGPLGVEGEQELAVPALGLPALMTRSRAAVREAEAVQLFLQRAAERDPGFQVPDGELRIVAAICHRLDGLPLAIELAAARVRTFGLHGLLSRLEQSTAWLDTPRRDCPARHRTLTGAIGWSYELLGAMEQRHFRLLSICEDKFRLETAAALLDDGIDAAAALDSLLEKGLLATESCPDGHPRFGMLGTIRDFARNRLAHADELMPAQQRHAGWFSAVALAEGAALTGPGQIESLNRLREAQHDIRAALAWLIEHGSLETAARMSVALHRHWLVRSASLRDSVELLTRLETRLERAEPAPDAALHARLLSVLGSLTGTIGTHQSVPHRHFEASLARFRMAGDPAGVATALNHLGWSAHLLGRLEEGKQASTEALEIHRRRGDQPGVAISCINLGWIALLRANFGTAERCFREAQAIHQLTGDRRSLAYATGHLASLALARGDAARALSLRDDTNHLLEQLADQLAWPTFEVRYLNCAREAMKPVSVARLEDELLPMLRAAGHGWAVGYALDVLAELRLAEGNLTGAHAAAVESLAVRQRAGVRSGEAASELLLGLITLRQGKRGRSAEHLAASLESRLEMGERLGALETTEAVSEWLLATNPRASLLLLAGCSSQRDHLGAGRTPRHHRQVERVWQQACNLCSDGTDPALRQGRDATLDALASMAAHALACQGRGGG